MEMSEQVGLAKGHGREPRIVFGPITSRRLGRSLGVDNLRGARCSYGCSYCEISDRVVRQRSRQRFFEPATIVEAVRAAVAILDEPVDFATIVPAGEPTLDACLGETITGLQGLGLRVAVFTNGSLLSRDDVRRELGLADWVSIKIDAADEATWRELNAPYAELDFDLVNQGMRVFAASFKGRLVTETTLVEGVNTKENQIEAIADLVSVVKPEQAYLTPARLDPGCHHLEAGSPITDMATAIFRDRFGCVAVVDPESDRPAGRRLHIRGRALASGRPSVSLPVVSGGA